MKLKNITKHGITLSAIEYSPRLSQETMAFTARCECDGIVGEVGNDGHGGASMIWPHALAEALRRRAATLPPLPPYYVGGEPLAYDADLLVAEALEAAIQAHEDKKMAKKGYTHVVRCEGSSRVLYLTTEPKPSDLAKAYRDRAPLAVVTAL